MSEEFSEYRICFFGHTHTPLLVGHKSCVAEIRETCTYQLDPEDTYLINPGSVGQPRDNDPRASYVTYDTDTRDVCYHRIEYDIKTAQRKMEEAKLPEMLIERLAIGK